MKKLSILTATMLTALFLFTGCQNSGAFIDTKLDVPNITVKSPSIVEGKLVTTIAADKYSNTPHGENQSPALSWESVEDANYYAVIMFDESANWLHFLVTDIKTTQIEQGKYTDAKDYIGPYPPQSAGAHTYRIEVFAIREQPDYPIGKIDTKDSYCWIVNQLNQVGDYPDNILARGHITGTYQSNTQTVEDME